MDNLLVEAYYSSAQIEPVIKFLEAVECERNGMSFSIYDTAFVLVSEVLDQSDQESLVEKITSQRQEDFTWADGTYLPHSKVLNTLAVVWAFTKIGEEVSNLEEASRALDEAILKCKKYPNHATVAFEFVAPLMARKLDGVLNLSPESKDYLESLYLLSKPKLDYVRAKLGFFNPSHTLSFTAELALFIEDFSEEEARAAKKAKLGNGSIGLSPAATAGTIILLKEKGLPEDPDLTNYLLETFNDYQCEGFPGVHPYEHMKYLWYLLPWMMSGDIEGIAQTSEGISLLTKIYSRISHDSKGRVSWDPFNSGENDIESGLPDLDDTSLAYCLYLILLNHGVQAESAMSIDSLQGFRREDGSFFCYPLETHPSPVAIMHALKSIELGEKVLGEDFQISSEVLDVKESLLRHLECSESAMTQSELEHLCHDKWHSTWTYGFQRWVSIKPVVEKYPGVVRNLVNFALEREVEGGWGQIEPTLEETSYVSSGLLKLLVLADNGFIKIEEEMKARIFDAITRTKRFMKMELANGNKRPSLWIAKTPYLPAWHKSAIYNALTNLFSAS